MFRNVSRDLDDLWLDESTETRSLYWYGATDSLIARLDPDLALAYHGAFERLLHRRSLPIAHADGGVTLVCDRWPGQGMDADTSVIIVKAEVIDTFLRTHFASSMTRRATSLLLHRTPKMSAATPASGSMRRWLIALAGVALVGVIAVPAALLTGLLALLMLYCIASMGLKALLTLAAILPSGGEKAFLPGELPTVTLFLPVFDEGMTLAALVTAIERLDYPSERLDVKFLVEESDHKTLSALDRFDLPDFFEVISIPKSEPQTKPKAMNYALPLARGEIIGIYDAEDIPERDQLRKAVAALHSSGPETVCVQGRLNHYNASEGWIPRWASMEYTLWFDVLLKGLSRLRLPVPLGGTSLFIETRALRAVHGWDPANVTEDADLGVRLARRGWRAEVIDSTTWEEAPGQCRDWIKQRTRWIKGFMVTWLVHCPNPVALWRDLGARGTVAINLMLLDGFLAFLLQPVFWALILSTIFAAPSAWLPAAAAAMLSATAIPFLVGHLFLVVATFAACHRRFGARRALLAPSLWIYWQIATVSAYRALAQMFHDRSGWEKTHHGRSRAATRQRTSARRTFR